ncbi:MAG: hypothetical protein AB1345_01785 [Chloroflexota bacterium]
MLIPVSHNDILLIMATVSFILGVIAIISGISVILARVLNRDIRTISVQTARMAQKGMSDKITGLVGNASDLLSALNGLTRSAAGVGLLLNIVGGGLIYFSYYILNKINWPA